MRGITRRPPDFDRGCRRYNIFHDFDPRKSGPMPSLEIPSVAYCIGDAVDVLYRSDKWHPGKFENYIHEHDPGVKVYVPKQPDASFTPKRVPAFIQRCRTLVLIGECLGFGFEDVEDGEVMEATPGTPRPQLYCTPDSHALLVVHNKRTVDAIFWGGKLRVTAHGIEG